MVLANPHLLPRDGGNPKAPKPDKAQSLRRTCLPEQASLSIAAEPPCQLSRHPGAVSAADRIAASCEANRPPGPDKCVKPVCFRPTCAASWEGR